MRSNLSLLVISRLSLAAAIEFSCSVPNLIHLEIFVDKAKVKSSDFITSSDPQAWVTVESQTKRTSKSSNTNRPAWEETLRFECISSSSPIHVEIFDYDGALEGSDDVLFYADWENWSSALKNDKTKLYNKNKDDAAYWIVMSVDFITSSAPGVPTLMPTTKSDIRAAPTLMPASSLHHSPTQDPSRAPSSYKSFGNSNVSSSESNSTYAKSHNNISSAEQHAVTAEVAALMILSFLILGAFACCMFRLRSGHESTTSRIIKEPDQSPSEISMAPIRVHSVSINPLPVASISSGELTLESLHVKEERQ
jgi:hypothetical protein